MKDTTQNTEDSLIISPFYRKDMFSYFCRYNELTDVVACPGVALPPLVDSCYIDIGIFDTNDNSLSVI